MLARRRCAPVVLVSHGFQTNYERGFANGLAAAGLHVTLIGSDRSDAAGLDPAVNLVNLRGSQEENRPAWRKGLNLLRYYLLLLGYSLWRWRSNLHVIGLIEPPLLHGIVLGHWFRLVSRRYVLTVHNILPHGGTSKRDEARFRRAYRLPRAFVVHTTRTGQTLVRDWGVEAQRIVLMEHGIEPGPPSAQAPQAVAGGPLRLLFFGSVAHYKGLDLLLDALQQSDLDFRLTVAGSCLDARLEVAIRAQIKAHRGSEQIQWDNRFVRDDELAALFLGADAIVLPYRHIDQSGVLFQALRYGLPVIASRVGAFEHYVDAEVGELCAADSAADLAAAIGRFAQRRGGLSRERIQAIGRAYEWPVVVGVLDRAYA